MWASRKVGRPVKWTSDRSEAFQTDAHGRDHISHAALALDASGKFLGLRVRTLANMGAYLSTFASAVPTYLYATLLSGPYDFPAIYAEVKAIFTNTVAIDAYRGAGRPEATYLLERLVDKAARQLGVDRIELRRKNIIRADQFPYQTPVALPYDIGDYHATLDLALAADDYPNYAERKAATPPSAASCAGFGISTYIEACGIAPSALAGALGARAGLYEAAPSASTRRAGDGVHRHAQPRPGPRDHVRAARRREARRADRERRDRPRRHRPHRRSAWGPTARGRRRSAARRSTRRSTRSIDKGKKIAAHLLEASVADIEFEDGKFRVAGTDREKTFGEIAFTAYVPHNYPIETVEPGLEDSAFYDPKNFTFPGGTHLVEVEIDPETGVVEVVDVAIADDVGVIINPMIVDGQAHGGLAQGIGQALLEECVYDADGQLLRAPSWTTACRAPPTCRCSRSATTSPPCTHNPLGVKGWARWAPSACRPR